MAEKTESKQIELSDGRSAVVSKFKGKHILEAQRVIGKDSEKMMFALIASCVKIDGQPVIIEDLDEMDGSDVLLLMEEFGGNF